MATDIVLRHEERFDVSGYRQASGVRRYPPAAWLFAVIDTLDAMTFDRPYRRAMPFDTVNAEIQRRSGTQFDPLAVEIFLEEEATLREINPMEFVTGKA